MAFDPDKYLAKSKDDGFDPDKYLATPVKEKEVKGRTSTAEAITHGVSQGLPFLDEAADFLEAGATYLTGVDSKGRPTEDGFKAAYKKQRDSRKKIDKRIEADRPYTSLGASLVSGAGPLGKLGKLAKLRKLSKAKKVATAGGVLAAEGGLDNLGRSHDKSVDDVVEGSRNALLTAGVLSGGGKLAKEGLKRGGELVQKGVRHVADKATGATSRSRSSNKYTGQELVASNAAPFVKNADEAIQHAQNVKKIVEDGFKLTRAGTQKTFQKAANTSREAINKIANQINARAPKNINIGNITKNINFKIRNKHKNLGRNTTSSSFRALDEIQDKVADTAKTGSFQDLWALQREIGQLATDSMNQIKNIQNKLSSQTDEVINKSNLDKISRKADIFGEAYRELDKVTTRIVGQVSPQAQKAWKQSKESSHLALSAMTMLGQAKKEGIGRDIIRKFSNPAAVTATLSGLYFHPMGAIATGLGYAGVRAVHTLGKAGSVKLHRSINRGILKTVNENSSKAYKSFVNQVNRVATREGQVAATTRALSLISTDPTLAEEIQGGIDGISK